MVLPLDSAQKAQNIRYYLNTVSGTAADSLGFAPGVLSADNNFTRYNTAADTLETGNTTEASVCTDYTYAFRYSEDPDAYYLQAHSDPSYLALVNNVLTTQDSFTGALQINLLPASSPVATENAPSATAIRAIGIEDAVLLSGAAAQQVTMTLINGQLLTTFIPSSDRITIPTPKGIVLVTVGETTLKVIVR